MTKIFFLCFILSAIIFLTSPEIFADGLEAFKEGPDVEVSEKYNPAIPVSVIEKMPLPKGYHEGLFLDGDNIWVANGKNINTWIISPDGSLKGEIIPPGTFTEGITSSVTDGKFWVTDWDTKKLYKVRIEDGKMEVETEISLAPSLPTGVVRAGDELYVMMWTRGMGTKYHLLKLDKEGNVLVKMRIRGISEPSQITWDGKYLWITSWFNRRVYKVDPESFRVLGHFASPAKDTTGIAWDGEHFWITGTSDDLYKVKVGE
jgi:glutamine cyclotransferase